MAKVNRNPKVRRRRRWFKNVGDPIDLANRGLKNPNDEQGVKAQGVKAR